MEFKRQPMIVILLSFLFCSLLILGLWELLRVHQLIGSCVVKKSVSTLYFPQSLLLVIACIPGVVWEQIWLQNWIQHIEKPECKFLCNWGSQWRLTAFCNFCVMTRASDSQFKLHQTIYKKFEFYFLSLSHYFEKTSSSSH